MKATISELWNTGRDILIIENGENRNISTIGDLKECTNVIVCDKINQDYEIILDNTGFWISFRTVKHPADGSKIKICEVIF